MRVALARAAMAVADCCLGQSRREWALAMRAEFEAAAAEGKPFAFAVGCLAAAWREMPSHAEGRLVLSNYALALGVLIPMAVLPFVLALGSTSVSADGGVFNAVLVARVSQNPLLGPSQADAALGVLALWLLIGVGHLRLAWVLVERDWARVAKAGALIGAALTTLLIFTAALAIDPRLVVFQGAALAIELWAVVGAARRHAQIFPSAPASLDS